MRILITGTEPLKPCILLAVLWSAKRFFAPNSPIFRIRLAETRKRRRRRVHAIAKRYAFHENAKTIL